MSRENAYVYDGSASEPTYYNYYRDYDPSTGRYVESDPIGLEGGLNTFTYVDGDPVSYIDPMGLDRWGGPPVATITITQFSDKAGQTWGAGVTVSGDAGNGVFRGNSFPSPQNGSPGIVDGTYIGRFGESAHKGKAGIILNQNKRIPTLGPNPNNAGSPSWADGIHMHCGGEFTRGSEGCLTTPKSECQQLWSLLRNYSRTVIIEVRRPKE